jgi:hypothetical protein
MASNIPQLREQIAKRSAGGDTPSQIGKDLGIDRHAAANFAAADCDILWRVIAKVGG